MRAFFLLHDEWCQYLKADRIAALYPFAGFIVVRQSRPPAMEFLKQRVKRLGLFKVLDEVLLRVYRMLAHNKRDHAQLVELMEQVKRELPAGYQRPPVHFVDNINSDEARAKLRELAPDVCVLMLHPMLGEKTFRIPKLRMLVYHPGVTPEYRGPHSAFWAVMNNEFWGIGWSLLQVDAGVDTGAVLAQSTCYGAKPFEQSHVVMQHVAHVEGAAAVAGALRKLEEGARPEVEMVRRRSTNYTHPGLSDYLKYRSRLKAIRAGTAAAGEPKPRNVG